MSDRVLTDEAAREVARRLLRGLSTPDDSARVVACSLVEANLCGHDSHGLIRLPWYAEFVRDGRAMPQARPEVVRESGAVAVIDGQRCWGQLAGRLAVRTASRLAAQAGVGVVTIRSANHVGRLGEYAEDLAERGLASVLWCNADPSVAPFGGRQRLLGTNPFAAGVPAADGGPPVIVDFATAAVAEGKLRVDRIAGRRVAPGLIQDAQGRPSTDPEDFYAGGALLPFGLHKGFGLAVLIELLGGALSGNHVGFLPEYTWGNGCVLIALRPDAFIDPDQFADEVTRAAAVIRHSPPAPGMERVLLPGDVERDTREQRLREGIPVPAGVWDQLTTLADRLAVAL